MAYCAVRKPLRSRTITAVLAAAALAVAAPAAASTVPADTFSELGEQRVTHPETTGNDAYADNVGDVNGDGRDDIAAVLGGHTRGPNDGTYVTFSPAAMPSTAMAGMPGWQGLKLVGSTYWAGGGSWAGVTGLGDVNGDGLREIAVASYGKIVVVFGRRTPGTVDMDALGDQGFVIVGANVPSYGGGGHICCGIVMEHGMLADAGDQNGDGRADLAFVDEDDVKVAFTPESPAGSVVKADAFGAEGFELDPVGYTNHLSVHTFQDTNDDGRQDLLVEWGKSGPSAHAAVAHSPGGGVDGRPEQGRRRGAGLRDARAGPLAGGGASARRPQRRRAPGRRDARPPGDGGRRLVVAYSPEAGVERDVRPTSLYGAPRTALPDGGGYEISVGSSLISDVGDLDGDQIPDLAFASWILYSSGGEMQAVGGGSGLSRLSGQGPSAPVVASVEDRNGDGKREIVTAYATPSSEERSTWHLDVWSSAPRPEPIDFDLPVDFPDGVGVGGEFLTNPNGDLRTLAARPTVEVTAPDGQVTTFPGDVVDARARSTRASVRFDPAAAGVRAGATYRYRLLLENSRGLVGTTQSRQHVYTPRAAPAGSGSASGAGTGPAAGTSVRPRPRLSLRTTPKRDRRRPYRVTVSGGLTRPAGVPRAAGCSGTVRVTVLRGRRTALRRNLKLSRTCTYRARLTVNVRGVPRRGLRLRIAARFTGNARLLAADARASAIRVRR